MLVAAFPPGRVAVASVPSGKVRSNLREKAGAMCDDGADDGVRTRDPDLGKVVLYQLSHVRIGEEI